MKKKTNIGGTLLRCLLLAVVVLGISMFNGTITGQSYTVVPTYDLMVRDVKAGDETIRIPAVDAFPEDDYYYLVSYKNGMPWAAAEGYLIHSKSETLDYRVQCHPVADGDTARRPNLDLLGTPVELRMNDDDSDGLWVGQIIFDLDGYRYWVRCESKQGIVEDAQPKLEKLAISILT